MSLKSLNRTASAVISQKKPAAARKQAAADWVNLPLDHNLVSERARSIWLAKGCPIGQDEENWLEAEAQIRNELAAV